MAKQREPKADFNPKDSLHLIKENIRKSFREAQAREILINIEECLESTKFNVPIRHNDYPLCMDVRNIKGRIAKSVSTPYEVHWEFAVWERYTTDEKDLPAGIKGLVSLQVMLGGKGAKIENGESSSGWGEIDLLAESRNSLPAVLELKRPESDDQVLKAVCQGVAYAAAIRARWRHDFGDQWKKVTKCKNDLDDSSLMDVYVAAPRGYWEKQENLFKSEQELIRVLREKGYDVQRMIIHSKGSDQDGLPVIERLEIRDWSDWR